LRTRIITNTAATMEPHSKKYEVMWYLIKKNHWDLIECNETMQIHWSFSGWWKIVHCIDKCDSASNKEKEKRLTTYHTPK